MKKNKSVEDPSIADEELRQRAISLYLQNWKIPAICQTVGCSRSWFFKWLQKFETGDPNWFKSESKTPKNIHKKFDQETEKLIINVRKKLMATPFSQYGPQAIYYDLEQQGYDPPPAWQIARVLERNNLSRPKGKSPYIPKGKEYPYNYILCQQMDLVGPRYLWCKARYYFLSLIDCDTHYAQTRILENKGADSICEELVNFWKVTGTPDFLQMDNDLSFWGSLIRPEAVGKIIRLCLSLKVTPVFIPLSEPWRNGVIEHFNNTMQQYVLKNNHPDIKALKKTARHFDEIHNTCHHYSSQNGKTPIEVFNLYGYPMAPLDESYKLPKNKIPLNDGDIHVIRFIRSNLIYNIFGLKFTLPEKAKYEYVKGIISVADNCLRIYRDHDFIKEFPFHLY